jgi:type IV pilus assembly protein PilZ
MQAEKQQTPNPAEQAPQAKVHRTLLSLKLRDDAALHSSYMPFIRGGAIFVPTKNTDHNFGDEVVISMHLESTNKKLAIPGKVVWIAPESCERGTQGLGIQFAGTTKAKVKLIIETMLGNRANVPPLVRFY